jgi:DNA polymerase IV
MTIERNDPGILHADLDAFFASVEQRDDPSLRGRPVLVGGGVIVAASYEAKRCGVRTPTNERAAKRLCPEAVVVAPRFDAYLAASREVFLRFHDVSPRVEGISIDEAFLDVRGARRLQGSALAIAQRLRMVVRDEVGLAVSVGIATTKALAKVASASAKPDGILEIPVGEECAFLHPLPIERLWGVGPKTSRRLRAIGVNTVGDIAALPQEALRATIGTAAAAHLHALAWNRDPRRVRPVARRRSIGSQNALGRPRFDLRELDPAILAIADRVSRRLRADDRLARTVTLRLRFADSERATRAASFAAATDSSPAIARVAHELLHANHLLIRQRGVTLVGVALSNLVCSDSEQLTLGFDEQAQGAQLDSALDDIRRRFGNASVTRATLLRRPQLQRPFGAELYE